MAHPRDRITADPQPLRTPFAELLKQTGVPVSSTDAREAEAAAAPPPTTGGLDLSQCGKIVLRRERKGRGGKTVTIIGGLPPATLPAAARALRKALGCGAAVEDDEVVVQGDLAERLRPWLGERGARRVVTAN